MTRILRLIRISLHLLKAFYIMVRYFSKAEPQKKNLTLLQRTVISEWLYDVLTLFNVSVYYKSHKKAQAKLLTKPIDINPEAKIIVANHVSWLDIVILGCLFPSRFIAKSEIAKWPLISIIIKKIGTFFIRRGRVTELKALAEHIKFFLNGGENLTFFPEGKTGEGDIIQSLFSGLFQIAIDTGTDIQPILLTYEDTSHPSKVVPYSQGQNILVNVWHLAGIDNIKLHFVVGDIISPQKLDRKTIAEKIKKQLAQLLENELASSLS